MSAEGFLITNPKTNNRDLEVTFVGSDGKIKKLKTLRPGEACNCDKRQVTVSEVQRPPRLFLENGVWVKDSLGRSPVRAKRV